jgi:RNA polymerase sigma factor (sigma-70 family)
MDELIIPAVQQANPYASADDGTLARGMALDTSAPEAWAVFYQQYAPRVLGYLKKRALLQFGQDVCIDLFLETIDRIQRSIDHFEYRGGSSLLSWCITIAHNVFRDYVRTDRARPAPAAFVPFDKVAEQLKTPVADDDVPMRSARETVMAAAFEHLSERYQTLLQLSICCGMSDAQIAGCMSVPEDRIRKLTYRARQALKKKFDALRSAGR